MPSEAYIEHVCLRCLHGRFKWWSKNKDRWKTARCDFARFQATKNRATIFNRYPLPAGWVSSLGVGLETGAGVSTSDSAGDGASSEAGSSSSCTCSGG